MSLLLETTLGDIVIDLDVEGSPELCKNVLKLAKARYYSQSLVYNVQANRFCQLGDPHGDGTGGACVQGLIACEGSLSKVLKSQQRFLKSSMGRPLTAEECMQKGRVVVTEMKGIPDTIGSQLLITTCEGKDMALDGYSSRIQRADDNDDNESRQLFRSIGMIVEDENNILDQIGSAFCDSEGRPYADIRIIRALIVDDPFEDPEGMEVLYEARGVKFQQKKEGEEEDRVTASPEWERPPEETIEERIPADQVDSLTGEESLEKLREREEEYLKKQDKSRAVVLEMLGDLPSADIKAPENVLFVCKLNPVTEDEDLELIFSRFDEQVKAEIIRDPDTGNSLQYAFVEFTKKEQAVEAYFKMNNALVDDRRIKVDFSQSVSKVWDKYNQRMRTSTGGRSNNGMPRDPFGGGPPRSDRGPRHSRGPPRGNDRDFRRNGPPNHDNRRHDHRGHNGRSGHDWDDRRRDDHYRGGRAPHRHSQDDHRRPLPHRGHGREGEHRGHRMEENQMEVDQFGREVRRETRPPQPREDSISDADSKDSRRRDRHRRKHHKERRKHHRSKDKKHRKRRSSRDDDYSSEGSSNSQGRSRDHDGHRGHRHSSGDRRRDRRERSRSRSRDRDRHRRRHDEHRRRSRSRSQSGDERRRERSREGKRKDRDRHRGEDKSYRSGDHDRKRRRRHDSPDR